MADQNFRVKNGLEVGTGITISSYGNITAGVITATSFVGDGSLLTNLSSFTSATSLSVTGVSTFSGKVKINGSNIILGDGSEVAGNQIKLGNGSGSLDAFGDSADLWIYHNSGYGNLLQDITGAGVEVWSTKFKVASPADPSVTAFLVNPTGATELYYGQPGGWSSSKKLATIGTGVTISGTTFTDQLSVSDNITASILSIGNSIGIANTSYLNGAVLFGSNAYAYQDIIFDNRNIPTGQKLSWWAPDADYAYIRYVSTGDDTSSKLELAVGNNGENQGGVAESVVVNRYNSSGNVESSLELFDEYGNTVIPGNLTVQGTINGSYGAAVGTFSIDNGTNIFSCLTSLSVRTTGAFNFLGGKLAGSTITAGSNNIFLGGYSGRSATTASNNIFLGREAGCSNTCGCSNVYLGYQAGRCNTGGSGNIFIGDGAGALSTTGLNNIFIGDSAGYNNKSGRYNIFTGWRAGFSNSTGCHNFFAGYGAGRYSSGGCHNNFFGECAAWCNSTGKYNNIFGRGAGKSISSGCHNNVFGSSAGSNLCTASFNNLIGRQTGFSLNAGTHNNIIGSYSGYCITSGSHNIFVGCQSGYQNTTGCDNIYIGRRAGACSVTGNNNIFIGQSSGVVGATAPYGITNITTESNNIIIGNDAHTCAQIQIAWTVNSDIRDKCIIGPVPHGRGFLQGINTIEFSFKNRETGELIDEPTKRRYGFSAQEILELEGENPVIVSSKNPEKLKLTSDYLIPVLVNAIKEISNELDALKLDTSKIKDQIAKIDQILSSQ